MAEFTAKFLFEPTPDQKQVVIQSFLFICFVKDVDLVWGIFSFNLQRLVDVELGNHFFFPLLLHTLKVKSPCVMIKIIDQKFSSLQKWMDSVSSLLKLHPITGFH